MTKTRLTNVAARSRRFVLVDIAMAGAFAGALTLLVSALALA